MGSRGYISRPLNPVVLAALSVSMAVSLALVWTYYPGDDSGSRLDNETRAVVAGESNRTPRPSAEMPEHRAQATVEDGGAAGASYGDAWTPPDAPFGDLAISGRVLTRAGAPVSGIELIATAGYTFDPQRSERGLPRGYRGNTTSGYDGAYEFQQLADGEYDIHTVETEQFAQARISVRAGVNFADLVLVRNRDLRVHGVVATASGEPLGGAQVRPVIAGGQAVTADNDGRYRFAVKVTEDRKRLAVRASKDGYKDQKIILEAAELDAEDAVALNIVMEPDTTALAVVSGTVRKAEGGPVAGQRIQISSGKTRQNYRATTDSHGQFVIQGVAVSDDYSLAINAADAYEDYFQSKLRVPEDGLTLDIELKARDSGTLTGRMVNLHGNPIPNFNLVLQTKERSFYNASVVGDAVGAFTVENAPAGELRFKTDSNPYHRIEGIRLAANAERHVMLVLDAGYDEIRGRVVNDLGYSVAVSNITLTWSHQQDGVSSSSRRTTAADAQGFFQFTQLGPGLHTIAINAPGYKPVRLNQNVAEQGFDVVVRLEEE